MPDNSISSPSPETSSELSAMARVVQNAETKNYPGIFSGIAALDRATKGWRNSSLYVVAGAASMGCTSLMLSFMRNAVTDFGCGTAFFSLQMACDKLLVKWISLELGLSFDKIEAGELSAEEWYRLNSFVTTWSREAGDKARIIDAPNPTIGQIAADCKRLRQEGVRLFIIDNINRITVGKRARLFCANREQELSYIVRRLKTLARELDAPVLVVSQLSRTGADRGRYGRPQLTDLRDSGAIENEADVVILLYRAEYYKFMEDENGNPTRNKAELIIAKNTFGRTENVSTQFSTESGLFKDLERDDWSADFSDSYSPATAPTPFPASTFAGSSPDIAPYAPNTIRLGSKMRSKSTRARDEEPPF